MILQRSFPRKHLLTIAKTVFAVIVITALVFTACNRSVSQSTASYGSQTHTSDTEEGFDAGFDLSSMLGGDLWFAAADTGLKVAYVNNDILNQFENYVSYFDESAPIEHKIIFTSTNAVDLEYLAIRIDYNEANGEFFLVEEASIVSPIVRPDRPFVVNWMEAGSLPQRAVAFYDRNDVKRYFTISGNNSGQGSPVLLIERQAAQQAAGVDRYAKILAGDFSDWSGIWANVHTRNRLFANGVFVNSSTRSIDGITTGDFNKNNGAYLWGLYDDGRLGYEIGLYHVGVQIYLGQNLIVSDTSKDRILIFQFDGFPTNDDVFYWSRELPA